MKRQLLTLSLLTVLLPTWAFAAINVNGTWKGNASKVTTASCSIPAKVILTLKKCRTGNLFNGTLKVGSDPALSVVGRIDPNNTFRITGNATTISLPPKVQTAILVGKAVGAKLQITEFQYSSITATSGLGSTPLSEMYDIVTLAK